MRYLTRNRITKGGAVTEFSGGTPVEMGTIQLTNRSGGVLEYGDVVVIDKTNMLSVTTTNTNYNDDVIGVVKVGGTGNQLITVQYAGIIDIKVISSVVNVGDNIYTGNISGHAYARSFGIRGAFAKALTSKPSGSIGTVKVLLSGGLPEVY